MRIFALIFLLLGLWAFLTGVKMGMEGWKARKWPTAKGRIVISKVEEWRTPGRIRIARLCLKMDYLYMVGDEILEGTRLDSGWRCFASADHMKEIQERYPVGKEVKVYYNPQNPKRCMLEPGLNWSVFFMLGLGLINCSIAIPIIKAGGRRGRNQPL